MRSSLRSLAFLAAALSVTGDAAAFCRTTTEPTPDGYDPAEDGCIDQGMPLAWPSMPVTYELHTTASTQVSLEAATSIFNAAFSAWTAVSCSPTDATEQPSLAFQMLAPTTAPFVDCDAQACDQMESVGPHQIVFRDDEWVLHDSANAIALTTLTFGLDTGNIHSANIEIDSHDYLLSAVDPPASGSISLSAIARHEAGHFLGLAHATDQSAVMYAFYQPDVIALTQDDIDGVCAIYPPPKPSSCACSTPGHTGGGGIPLSAGVIIVVVRAGRRRSRRASRSQRATG